VATGEEQATSGAIGRGKGADDNIQVEGPIEVLVRSEQGFLDQVRLVPGESEGRSGLRIDSLEAGGSAERSGLSSGDLIIAINGEPVQPVAGINRLVKTLSSPATDEWRIVRRGTSFTARIVKKGQPNGS